MDEVAFKNRAAEMEMKVAASLTAAACSAGTHSASYVVKKYRAILHELRSTGGPSKSDGAGE